MGALSYLLKRTIINYFKKLKEKPQKIIGPIFVALWLIIMFIPQKKKATAKTAVDTEIYICIFIAIIIISLIYSLYKGTKSLDSKFAMSDVNLIFTSPIKPQTILLYGVIKQIAVELLASIYIIYQIPNFMREFNVPGINSVILILYFMIFQFVFCNTLKLLIFALNTKYKNLGSIIRNGIKAFFLVLTVIITLIIFNGTFQETAEYVGQTIAYGNWFKYIPVIGWTRGVIYKSLTGIKATCIIYFIALFLTSITLLYITYCMKLDFYEDMVKSAENNDIIHKIKTGENLKNNNKRKFFLKPIKKVKFELNGKYGAKVIFFKNMNEYMKRSIIFFINTYSLILLVISLIICIFGNNINVKPIFLASCLMLFFSVGFGGKIYTEITYHYIYLIPDKPEKKLFYGILSSLFKIFMDGVLLFLPLCIVGKVSMLETFLCILCYLTLGGMLSYSGLFAFRISEFLGFTGVMAKSLFFMFFQLLLMIPAIIIVVITTASLNSFIGWGIYVGIFLYSIGFSALFSLGCVPILDNMEG